MIDYKKTEWKNGITPVNEDNLNHIEQGIYDLDVSIDKLAPKDLSELPSVVLTEDNLESKAIFIDDNGTPSKTTLRDIAESFKEEIKLDIINSDIQMLKDNESTLYSDLSNAEFELSKIYIKKV